MTNRLQLSLTKTDFLWCCWAHRQHHIATKSFHDAAIQPLSSVHDLGVCVQ